MTDTPKKKLIEVSLPLEKINDAARHEKSVPRKGHPATMHLYWARRPLAAARAVLFAQLVDDPSAHPELFPTVEAQDAERARLHALLEKLVVWENSNDETLLAQAREEIRKSNGGELPAVLDPFAGGGSIPLEAQRLGLEAHASDLNPLAVLINKALIEIPPKFAGREPVFPKAAAARTDGERTEWKRAEGLAADVRHYGEWMRDEAQRRIGHLYPKVTAPDGTEHTVIAWIWARTVKNPNPANPIEVPLVRSWWLSKKKGKEAWIHASVNDGKVNYEVRHDADGPTGDDDGTVNRGEGTAVGDGTLIPNNYIRTEAQAQRLGAHLIAIVAEDKRGRLYLSPASLHVEASRVARPKDVPEQLVPKRNHDVDRLPMYGMPTWADAFTNRQLVALTTLSDLVSEAREQVLKDALAAGLPHGERLEDGGTGAEAYADAVATYLSFGLSKLADWSSSLCGWIPVIEGVRSTFSRQALPMVWDYAEINPFSESVGNISAHFEWVAACIDKLATWGGVLRGRADIHDAANRSYPSCVVSTDPPYYDNIGYSDLSDYFYVWLRRAVHGIQSKTLATMLTPKREELVANPYRHDGRKGAEEFFVDGFNTVFTRIREAANPTVPLTVYYAYKQQDTRDSGTASTGWHTLLDGLINSGWEITATWPMRSERGARMNSIGANALASSIVLACRPRSADAPTVSRRAFITLLKQELPRALRAMLQGTVAPVDLAQAAIGPGISVFSRFARVVDTNGADMTVRDALILINATLDEVLGEQEYDFDPDTRFAVKWYRQHGWREENAGIADQLARASDTSIGHLERGGILIAKGGKAHLVPPMELADDWDPQTDPEVSMWEVVVRLAAAMAKHGADRVAELLGAVQARVNPDAVKELGFLLFHEAEKLKHTHDAILFNNLVSAWVDITAQARNHVPAPHKTQQKSNNLSSNDLPGGSHGNE